MEISTSTDRAPQQTDGSVFSGFTASKTKRSSAIGIIVAALLLLTCFSCRAREDLVSSRSALSTAQGSESRREPSLPVVYDYRVVNRFPHDPAAFTQGLFYWQGHLYESTGQYGNSSLRRVDLTTGDVEMIVRLDRRYFGEGIVRVDDRIVQLTWQENTAFVYRIDNFERVGGYSYAGEGWGLTSDGARFIMSDGSARLTFRDLVSFEELGSVVVTDRGRQIRNLNELEWIDGLVYANVFGSDLIAMIDPTDGVVRGWIDLRGLLDLSVPGVFPDVLNGIAWDSEGQRLLVTGKRWPALYEIELIPR